MIWAILLMGLVMGGTAAFSIWFYQKFSTGRQVDPLQNGGFIKGFRGQFETEDHDPDSDKLNNGRD